MVNKSYPQNNYPVDNLDDLDEIDLQDQETDFYEEPAPNKNLKINKINSPLDLFFGTPVEAGEQVNVSDYLPIATSETADFTKTPVKLETPSTNVPKKEKPAINTDETAYDMNGIPIGGPGTNEWYQKQEKQRNFIFGNISEKLLTGEDINEEDISKSSYLESVIGGLIDATIKAPFVFNYIGAALIDYFGEEGIPVEQSEVAKLTKAIESIPILGDIDKVSKEAAEATLPGQIAHIIGEVVGANKWAGAMKVGQLVTDYALSGRLMLGGGKNVVEASKVATELNKISGTQRFFAIAAGDATEGILTNALIVDAGTWETLGNFSFIGGPTAADTIERKTSKEEAERLLLNRLKFGVEGGVLGGAIGAIRGGYRVLFSSGDSEIYKEAAKQTQNSIKTESKLEEMASKYGKEDLVPETYNPAEVSAETTGTTLYSGLPVDEITDTIIKNASKAKQTVTEYLESKGIADKLDKGVLSLLRSRGRLPEDVFNKYYYAEKAIVSAEMHGGSAYAELQGTLNETFKERTLLNKTSSSDILRETNDLLLNTKNEIVTLPDGSVQLEFKGFKDIKTSSELTPTKRQSYLEKEEYFKKRWNDSLDQNDGLSAGKFAKQSREYGAAAYKNKPIEELTTKDYLDYHKYKHPKDYFPERYKEYPGEHWVDRLLAKERIEKGITTTEADLAKGATAEDLYRVRLKELGVSDIQIDKLIQNVKNTRNGINEYFNRVIKPENMEKVLFDYEQLMNNHVNNYWNSEYKIFRDSKKTSIFGNSFKPTEESIEDIKNIIRKNAEIPLSEADVQFMVGDIINAKMNPKTGAPTFTIKNIEKPLDETEAALSKLKPKTEMEIDLSKMIDREGQFQRNVLIKTEDDLKAFQRFFGADINPSRTALNLISDAGMYSARSKLIEDIKKANDARISQGLSETNKPLFIEGSRSEAQTAFNIQNPVKFVADESFKFISPFEENKEIWFASQDMVDAMNFAYKLPLNNLFKQSWMQSFINPINSWFSGKSTVLSLPRETLNFIQYATDTFAMGNLFKNHTKMWESFKQDLLATKNLKPEQLEGAAFGTAFKKFLGKNLPDDQFLTRFFNESGIGMSNLNVRALDELFKESQIFKNLTQTDGSKNWFKWFYEKSRQLYMGVDNAFKYMNVVGEYDGLKQAYLKAFEKGTIKEMPSFDFLWKRASENIQDLFPNYDKAFEGVKVLSKFPVLGNFVMWPSEKWRNILRAIDVSTKQMKGGLSNPEFGLGFRRLAGMTMVYGTALGGGGSYLLNRLYTGFDALKEGAGREYVADFEKSHSLIFVPKDKFGNIGYVDLDHFNSASNVSTFLNSVFASINSDEFQNRSKSNAAKAAALGIFEAFKNTTESYRDPRLSAQMILDLSRGETADGRKIWLEADSATNKILKIGKYILEGAAPPIEWYKRMYHATNNTPDERGKHYNFLDEVLTPFGFRIKRIDPVQKFDGSMGVYKEKMRNTDEVIRESNRQIGRDKNDFIQTLYDATEQKYDAMTELKNKLRASKILGGVNAEEKIYEHHVSDKNLLGYLEEGIMQPINTYIKGVQRYISKEEELRDKYKYGQNLAIPDNDAIIDRVGEFNDRVSDLPLGRKFKDLVNVNRFLFKVKPVSSVPVSSIIPPLTQNKDTYNVNPNVVTSNNSQQGIINTQTGTLNRAEEYKQLFNT